MVSFVAANSVHYRLLSEHFQACVDLSERDREMYLSAPNVRDLSEELRSLLHYHREPLSELPVRPERSRPSFGSTLLSRLNRPFMVPLGVLVASTLLLAIAARHWAWAWLEGSSRAQGARLLQQELDFRVAAVHAWASRKRTSARSVLEDPAVASEIAALAEAARASGGAAESIRSSSSCQALRRRLSRLPDGLGECGFCVFSPAGVILCSDQDASVGHALTLGSAACLREISLGEWIVSRPVPEWQLGLHPGTSDARPVMFAGGPVSVGKDQPIAFGAFYFSAQTEFYGLLAPAGKEEFLAFDEKGLLLNNLRDTAALRKAGLLEGPREDQTAFRVYLRDPQRELPDGGIPEAPVDQWAPTRMCLSATQGHRGSDCAGYRNLMGRPVLGAWAWLPEQRMAVGVEEDLEAVLTPLRSIRLPFLFFCSFSAVLIGVLSFAYGCIRRRSPEGKSRFGFYTVERPIGQGGVGDVFLATHSILNRSAAIKILREPRPSQASVARFKREARMASRLGHPNSIQIFDYGESSDGRLYYAMEYVEGLNLAQLLTLEGTLSVARSLYLLKQISGAMEEAHALGVVHRDLKPANIMVGRKGGLGDVVKILDFGIASSVSGSPDDSTRSTHLVGTPAFLAPERIQQPNQVDFRSDIYSFGGVAFHLLTGRSIFEGPGPAELIYQVLSSKRPSPSQLRGEPLPEALEGLIMDCLAIDPDLRPASMRELTEQLRAIEVEEPWSQDEARAWWAARWESVAKFTSASA